MSGQVPADADLLGVIEGDDLAPRCLAAWKALGCSPERLDDAVERVADLLELPEDRVAATLGRCRAARLLLEGDVTPAASLWIKLRLLPPRRRGRGRRQAEDA